MSVSAIPCAAVPEFAVYREQHSMVKDALLEESGGEQEAFIERASQTIAQKSKGPGSI